MEMIVNVGLDVHVEKTTVCFLDPGADGGGRPRTRTVPTTREGLESALRPLFGCCRVAFEVGPQAQWVASIVRPLAAEVQVANPSRIPWLFRDGRKNDKLDACKLATLLALDQLPTVHLPSADVSAWRALINHRRTVVKHRGRIKNQVRAILRTFGYRCPHKSCWSRIGRVWLTSLTFDGIRSFMMQSLLSELDALTARLEGIEFELNRVAWAQPDVARLQTIPGVGPRTAEAIVAFTDRVDRFRHRKRFASYFGMIPTQDASGRRERFGHISKRGPSVVRWLIVEATHVVIRRNPELRAYFDRVWRGRRDRYKKAIVATGRKLLTIAFAMLRDQTVFQPDRRCPAA